MTCKKCNGKISPSDDICPNCGAVPVWEGGNGFWDLAGKKKPTFAKSEHSTEPKPKDNSEESTTKTSQDSAPESHTSAATTVTQQNRIRTILKHPRVLYASFFLSFLLLFLMLNVCKVSELKRENEKLTIENDALEAQIADLIKLQANKEPENEEQKATDSESNESEDAGFETNDATPSDDASGLSASGQKNKARYEVWNDKSSPTNDAFSDDKDH